MLNDEEAQRLKSQLLAQLDQFPEGQASQIKEKIESMNAQELEEFIEAQKKGSCLFCRIAQGEIKTIKVYEDSDVLVVLDIAPASPGHMLIMPKNHYAHLSEIPEALLFKVTSIAKTMSQILEKALGAQGTNIFIADREVAGQKVEHFTVNVIPRSSKDNIKFEWQRQQVEDEKLEDIAKKIVGEAQKAMKQEETPQERRRKREEKNRELKEILKQLKRRLP